MAIREVTRIARGISSHPLGTFRCEIPIEVFSEVAPETQKPGLEMREESEEAGKASRVKSKFDGTLFIECFQHLGAPSILISMREI